MTATKTMNNQKSRGFTLIELLTVMIIISILAIISLGVQRASVMSARTARTRTTIMKIDTVLTGLYEKYQYRKVDVDHFTNDQIAVWVGAITNNAYRFILPTDDSQLDDSYRLTDNRIDEDPALYAILSADTEIASGLGNPPHISNLSQNLLLKARQIAQQYNRQRSIHYLRIVSLLELLRMDMPINVAEAYHFHQNGSDSIACTNFPCNRPNKVYSLYGQQESVLHASYQPILSKSTTNAELLYLIITNGDPETRTMFHDREIGVGEGGGNVFLDGWGNPIGFLRWAPGLAGSSRQPTADMITLYQTNRATLITDGFANTPPDTSHADYSVYQSCMNFQERYANPLNPLGLSGYSDYLPNDWLLVPLVFSLGPDGELGMTDPNTLDNTRITLEIYNNPYIPGFLNLNLGADDSTGASQDNITNHNYYNE